MFLAVGLISAGKDGETPLHMAAVNDQHMVVQLLLERGADLARRGTPFTVSLFENTDFWTSR